MTSISSLSKLSNKLKLHGFHEFHRLQFFILFLVLISLTTFTTCHIIPDIMNPLQFNKPNNNMKGYNITLRFTLEESQGVAYKQYFGIKLPDTLPIDDSEFNKPLPLTNKPKYDCFLSDSDNNNYQIVSVMAQPDPLDSTKVDKNTLYCRLDDTKQAPIQTGKTKKYSLTIQMNQLISTNFLNIIGFFTSTNITPDKIIIEFVNFYRKSWTIQRL